MNKINYQDPADLIDKDIFELMGIKNAPEETKKEITDNMMATIQNRVMARILDKLDEEQVKEFEKLVDTGKEEEINKYLEEKGINVAQLSAEEALLYKTELLNQFAAAQPAQNQK